MIKPLPVLPLPENHGDTILELWAVCRDVDDVVEIAEHEDGAMKAYASKEAAEAARAKMGEPWTVQSLWLLEKGYDVEPAAYRLAKTGMFSEQAIRSVDGLIKQMRHTHR